ncbi:hypothetical protein NEIRO03_1792 [Nematocida sp. AWRm78]|nr:hypothetical protein NEIRO02_1511 [Nematocida sp. AWRm79]KAI5184664.1 hypothetical protein NEIRO03_1792 [Nematocida sp. AWRm78]
MPISAQISKKEEEEDNMNSISSSTPLNTTEYTDNESRIEVKDSTNELEKGKLLEEGMISEVDDIGGSVCFQISYTMHIILLRAIFNAFAVVFFSKMIIDIILNIYAMNNNLNQSDYQRNLLNLERPFGIKISLILYIVYFMFNLIYSIYRYISLFSPFFGVTLHDIINNIHAYDGHYSVVCIITMPALIMGGLIISSNGNNMEFTPVVWAYIVLQSVYLISEGIFSCFNKVMYHIYKPTTKKMKILSNTTYYVNHIMLFAICLVFIFYSTELVPLAIVDRVYWNETIPNINTNTSI